MRPTLRSARAIVLAALIVSAIAPRAFAQSAARVIPGVPYAQRSGGPLLLDVYIPAGLGPFPGVILIHGGGWKEGSRLDENKVATFLASDGFVAISVDYRLISAAPYPAALHDVQDAVRFIRSHAKEYSVDPSALGAMGFSAGGELAGLLGTVGHGSTSVGSRVSAVATFSGPMNLETLLEGNDPNAQPLVVGYLGCEPSPACDAIARQASPIDHVDASDAPMYLVNSSAEAMPLPQATSMKATLQRVGVTSRVTVVPGSQHVPLSEATLAGAAAFLSTALGSTGGGTGVGASTGGPTASLGPAKFAEGAKANLGAHRRSSFSIELIAAFAVVVVGGALGYAAWTRRRFRYYGATR